MSPWMFLDWLAAGIIIGSMIYITFILTVPEWLSDLRKGEAISLLPEQKGRTWPLWAQLLVLLAGLCISIPLFVYFWTPLVVLPELTARLLDILGLIIYVIGFSITLWARASLGKNWGISTSYSVKLRSDHELIEAGPYAFIRHPMYFGVLAFGSGVILLYPTWVILIFFISVLAALPMRAIREETALSERFGAKWSEYKKRTKFIIPFLI